MNERGDPSYIDHLRQAKEVSAVTKIALISFASGVPDSHVILAYEGPADKCMYYHWIKQLSPGLRYEPFTCKSKAKVLQLFDSLQSDLTGLKARVYFLVDHDFDGIQGRGPSERLFVTDAYSIENYVVCSEVLDDLLKLEFHCDGFPRIRQRVIEVFSRVYEEFLKATSEINFRIFIARRGGFRQLGDLPERINQLAIIDLCQVVALPTAACEVVKLNNEPSESEVREFFTEFQLLEPKKQYRGKFALVFFIKWLALLREERLAPTSDLFETVPASEYVIPGNFSLATLAPKAPPPPRLGHFLSQIPCNRPVAAGQD